MRHALPSWRSHVPSLHRATDRLMKHNKASLTEWLQQSAFGHYEAPAQVINAVAFEAVYLSSLKLAIYPRLLWRMLAINLSPNSRSICFR